MSWPRTAAVRAVPLRFEKRQGYTAPMAETLADIVKPNFIEVAPEDTLGEVAEQMTARNVGAVVVKDFGKLIGILTERDLLKAMAARVHTSEARVRQWMTEDPITVPAETPLDRGCTGDDRPRLPPPPRPERRPGRQASSASGASSRRPSRSRPSRPDGTRSRAPAGRGQRQPAVKPRAITPAATARGIFALRSRDRISGLASIARSASRFGDPSSMPVRHAAVSAAAPIHPTA